MRRNVTRRLLALLLTAAMCTGLCTGLTVSAEEMNEGAEKRTEQTEAGQEEDSLTEEGAGEPETPQAEEQEEGQETAETPETGQETLLPKEEGAPEGQEALENQEEEQSEEQEQTEKQERKAVSRASAAGLSDPRIEADSSMTAKQKVTWDCVWFGSYPQSEVTSSDSVYGTLQNAGGWDSKNEITVNGNRYRRMKKGDATYTSSSNGYYSWSDSTTWHYFKYEPIKWRVLKINGNQALLLSDVALDDQKYHTVSESVTWETSTIRSWLNGYSASANKQGTDYSGKNFIGSAFNSGEQSAIVTTSVVNADNISYGTAGGNNTSDKVFLLSASEVYGDSAKPHGFVSSSSTNDEARRCKSSTYAKAMGAYGDTSDAYKGNCWWWLRSPGSTTDIAAYVYPSGYVDYDGYFVNIINNGVRAALNLNLSSNQWSSAGTVCSDGTGEEVGGGTGGTSEEKDPETQVEKKYKDSIKNALPDMKNLGSATLKGPELSIAGNTFNLFKTDMKMSLPLFDNVTIKADEKTKTAEVLIGFKEGEISTKGDDKYWSETYKEVKSLVKACGGTVDTTKLWNRFSRVRGKLKSLDANAVFKVNGNVTGYMKVQMNDDGGISNVLESGIMAGFEAGASVKTPLWWIVYSEFGIKGSVNGKMYLNLQNVKAVTAKGEIGLAIKPSIAIGADVVVVDVKGGIEGEIGGKATFPWKEFSQSVNAYLTGKLFLKVDTVIPGLSGEFPYNFPKLELYPNLGKVTKNMPQLQYEEPEPVTKQMVRNLSPYSQGAVDTTEESIVYENAKPQMLRLSDGRILMVYLDDTSRQAKLMYRIYNGSEWSEAKTVWNGGNLDTAGYLYRYNNSVYVIFESSSKEITESMTAEEIAGAMNLYAAEFSAGTFSEPVRLGNSGTWKYAYQLTEKDGNLCAVWAENSDNDVMLESGGTVIYESQLKDTWQSPVKTFETGQPLTEIVSGDIGGTFRTAYIREHQIYIDEEILDTGEYGKSADSLRLQDGTLYARLDGSLCSYDGNTVSPRGVECTTSYQIEEGAVYWIQQNNFRSEMLRKQLDSEENPVAVTDEGGYVGSFAVAGNTGGSPAIAYTCQQVDETDAGNPYGKTLLKFTENVTRYQAEIANVAYDVLSFVPGERNPVIVTVCNTGTDTVNRLTLTVSDGERTLYEGSVADSLQAGESKECEILVEIPEGFTAGNLKFSLTADEAFQKQGEENQEFVYCTADIGIEENTADEITVRNHSEEPAENVTVILRNQNENGSEIRRIPFGKMKAGETKKVSVKDDWKKAVKNPETNKKYLYCEAVQDAEEYELWNNNVILEKEENSDNNSGGSGSNVNGGENSGSGNGGNKGETAKKAVKVSKITISGISKKIAAGKKIKLTAEVKPFNAKNKAVTWKSGNTKVATVNSKGVVTLKKNSGGKSVTITATAKDGSKKATYKITSMKGVVKKVAISGKKTRTLKAGKTLKLKAKVTASNSRKANKKLKWTSSNRKYATVTGTGKVKTKKAGKGKTVKITAVSTDGSNKKASVKVKLK